MKQPQEVIEAYNVCSRFQQLLAPDLDFEKAFEATFTNNPNRRREIATEGEFGKADPMKVNDATLTTSLNRSPLTAQEECWMQKKSSIESNGIPLFVKVHKRG